MRKKPPKLVTVRDVAKVAGVSPITVSRALQNSTLVREATRIKVRKAAEELAYIPNFAAGTLSSNVSHMVGVIVPNMSNSIFAETLQSIANALRPSGYNLLIGHSDYSLEQEEMLLRTFLSRRADAIVLTGCSHSDGTRAMLKAAGVPTVEMWSLPDEPIGVCVGISNHQAAFTMTNHLLAKGHRKIGFIGGELEDNDRTQGRLQGYRDALSSAGIDFSEDMVRHVAFEFQNGSAAMAGLLDGPQKLDAVFAASDILATGALLECLRRGLRVPQDIAVGGLDDAGIAGVMTPALTTIAVPRQEIGQKVADVISDMLSGIEPKQTVFDMGFTLIERETT